MTPEEVVDADAARDALLVDRARQRQAEQARELDAEEFHAPSLDRGDLGSGL